MSDQTVRRLPRFVPSHLGNVFPFDTSMFVFMGVLLLEPDIFYQARGLRMPGFVQIVALLSGALLITGWLRNDRRITKWGCEVATVVWAILIFDTASYTDWQILAWWLVLLMYSGFLILSVGVWAVIRRTPEAGEKAGWWMGWDGRPR